MDNDNANGEVFKEYRELGPQKPSMEQYTVALTHVTFGIAVSVVQINEGIEAWFRGLGLVTPILLIAQGLAYCVLKNPQWYREQMVPFILDFVMVPEIEAEQYVSFHRRLSRCVLVFGWIAILLCQAAWTYGLTALVPLFTGNDIIARIVGELVAYAVIFGPFFLYVVILLGLQAIFEKNLRSKNQEIQQMLDIEERWSKEYRRRVTLGENGKNPIESPSDRWFS